MGAGHDRLHLWHLDPRDDLVRALGCDSGISKSTVSRICSEIDEQVEAFRTRSGDHITFPYVFLDATYIKARVGHRIVSRAVVVATGVTADGNREVCGLEVGDSEDEVFWTAFLRSLRDRGLSGVVLVISDAHSGLKAAISRVFQGAAWLSSSVHYGVGREGPACHPRRRERTLGRVTCEVPRQTCPSRRGRALHWLLGVAPQSAVTSDQVGWAVGV